MISAGLPLWGVALGASVIFAGLVLLHILRTRYRTVVVAHVYFWQQALKVSRAQRLWESFRHPLSLLLLTAICLLLWLAFSQLAWQQKDVTTHYAIWVDASAASASPEQQQRNRDALLSTVSALPQRQVSVVYDNGATYRLLGEGESSALVTRRLDEMHYELAPSSVAKWLTQQQKQATLLPEHRFVLTVIGGVALEPTLFDTLPTNVQVTQQAPVMMTQPNTGVVTLGQGPAASGASDKVDVVIALTNNGVAPQTSKAPTITITHANKLASVTATEQDEQGRFWLRDVPANGGVVNVTLAQDDGFSQDNQGWLQLVDRTASSLTLSQPPSSAVQALFAAMDVHYRIAEQADFTIAADNRLTLTIPATQTLSASMLHTLDKVAFPASIYRGERRRVSVPQGLVDALVNPATAHDSAVILSRLVGWVADYPAAYPYLAAGQPIHTWRYASQWQQAASESLLMPLLAPSAGKSSELPGAPAVTLLDRALSEYGSVSTSSEAPMSQSEGQGMTLPFSALLTWLLAGALGLLLLEWILVVRRWLP